MYFKELSNIKTTDLNKPSIETIVDYMFTMWHIVAVESPDCMRLYTWEIRKTKIHNKYASYKFK